MVSVEVLVSRGLVVFVTGSRSVSRSESRFLILFWRFATRGEILLGLATVFGNVIGGLLWESFDSFFSGSSAG
jgi:hypothetical protein